MTLIRKELPIVIIILFLVSTVTPMILAERNDAPQPSNVKTEFENGRQVSDSGLMNSSWPMHCHDNRHTGRSPYSTQDNPGVVKWFFKASDSMGGSPAIDKNGTIYCSGGDILYAINPNGTRKWSLAGFYDVCSTPAIDVNGLIYVTTRGCALRVINPNGTIKWTYHLSQQAHGSPAIDNDGTIYAYSENKLLYAFYQNGTLKWSYYLDAGYIAFSSPALGIDGTIYIGSLGPGDYDGYVDAVNPNGTRKWRYNVGTWVHGSAAIADDGTIIQATDINLIALNPNNGSLKWISEVDDCTWTTPIIGPDGTIYVGSSLGSFYAVNPDDGTIKWRFPISAGFWFGASPALSYDGTVYFGTTSFMGGSAGFYAVDALTGKEKWNYTEGGYYESSPAIGMDGTVYATAGSGSDGYLYAFGRGPMSAEANGPYKEYAHRPIQFVGTIIGGIPPYTVHWDFGDGNTSNERKPKHTYDHRGNYTATFTVTDADGNSSSDTASVVVDYALPTVSIIKPTNALYFMNIKILPTKTPFVIGKISIEVKASQEDGFKIVQVEFNIDDDLTAAITSEPFIWIWKEFSFGEHHIDIKVVDSNGHVGWATLYVWKLF
jgi:outer membrane protein assembly factor BamB